MVAAFAPEDIGPRRLVLHVGLPKCGSTTLQNGLASAADALADQGALFVRLRPIKLIEVLARGGTAEQWQRLLGERAEDLVILSSEYLCTLDEAGIHGLVGSLPFEVDSATVVFVLRPLEDWTLSRMNQRAQGLPRAAPEDDHEPTVGLDVGDLDVWLATWSAWVAERPRERRLTLLPMTAGEPLIERFLDAVGLHPAGLPAGVGELWSNRSVTDEALELIALTHRLANQLARVRGLDSIREDDAAFPLVKRMIALAKRWERADGKAASPDAIRRANKAASRLRAAIEEELDEPFLGEVLRIIGTHEGAMRRRKAMALPPRA